MFAVSPARNVPECKAAHAPTAVLAALREKTSFAKSATVHTPKASSFALNAASSHAKPPSKDPSTSATASTFRANPKIVSFKSAVANLAVITYGFS